MVDAAGGAPCFGVARARSVEAAWDELAAADPEVIVLGLCGFGLPRTLDEWHRFTVPPALRTTPAWRHADIWAIDGSAYVSRPGPRLVDGVEILSAIVAGRGDEEPRAARLRS
jgi:iron complex transport system substrate-binding protein